MNKIKYLAYLFFILLFVYSCSNQMVNVATCQEQYNYFPDAEDCVLRKFNNLTLKNDNSEDLKLMHTEIVNILKQKIYESRVSNSKAWFEYNDLISTFNKSKEKQNILENYLKIIED